MHSMNVPRPESEQFDSRRIEHFVSCLLHAYRQSEAPDLLPYFTREEAEQLGLDGYIVDTFSSVYDEFGTEFDAHGA
jgi:hypothetical protein